MSAPAIPPAAVLPPPPPPRVRRWPRYLLYAGLLLCGMVLGAALALGVLRHQLLNFVQHPELRPAMATQRLTRLLSLSPDQRTQVQAILTRHQTQVEAIRRDFQPRLEHELDALNTDLSPVLDPTQRARWDKVTQHLRTVWLPALPPKAMVPSSASPAAVPPSSSAGT